MEENRFLLELCEDKINYFKEWTKRHSGSYDKWYVGITDNIDRRINKEHKKLINVRYELIDFLYFEDCSSLKNSVYIEKELAKIGFANNKNEVEAALEKYKSSLSVSKISLKNFMIKNNIENEIDKFINEAANENSTWVYIFKFIKK